MTKKALFAIMLLTYIDNIFAEKSTQTFYLNITDDNAIISLDSILIKREDHPNDLLKSLPLLKPRKEKLQASMEWLKNSFDGTKKYRNSDSIAFKPSFSRYRNHNRVSYEYISSISVYHDLKKHIKQCLNDIGYHMPMTKNQRQLKLNVINHDRMRYSNKMKKILNADYLISYRRTFLSSQDGDECLDFKVFHITQDPEDTQGVEVRCPLIKKNMSYDLNPFLQLMNNPNKILNEIINKNKDIDEAKQRTKNRLSVLSSSDIKKDVYMHKLYSITKDADKDSDLIPDWADHEDDTIATFDDLYGDDDQDSIKNFTDWQWHKAESILNNNENPKSDHLLKTPGFALPKDDRSLRIYELGLPGWTIVVPTAKEKYYHIAGTIPNDMLSVFIEINGRLEMLPIIYDNKRRYYNPGYRSFSENEITLGINLLRGSMYKETFTTKINWIELNDLFNNSDLSNSRMLKATPKISKYSNGNKSDEEIMEDFRATIVKQLEAFLEFKDTEDFKENWHQKNGEFHQWRQKLEEVIEFMHVYNVKPSHSLRVAPRSLLNIANRYHVSDEGNQYAFDMNRLMDRLNYQLR